MYTTLSSARAATRSEINLARPAEVRNEKLTAADEDNSQNLVVTHIVPTVIIAELDANDMHGFARDIILWIVCRHVTRGISTGLHQILLSRSVGSTIREQVIDYIDQSKYIKVALSGLYRRGSCAMRYHPTDAMADLLQQHNYERCCDIGMDGMDGMDVCWRTVDYRPLRAKIEAGFQKLGWDISRVDAEWTLKQADQPTMTDAEIIEHFTPVEADGEIGTVAPDDLAKVDAHQAAYGRYRDHRTDRILRRDGRTYTSVTSLPRWIREREVVFAGGAETLDISACYWWILAADHRLSRIRYGLATDEIDGLMDLIECGDFYGKMAKMTDMPYGTDSERKAVKVAVQQHCLFSCRLGRHPLWDALRSICPQICKTIQWWHQHRNGRSELAYFLMRGEGQLMTNGLVKWLVAGGVPAIQIHDGAIVPVGAAKVAAEVTVHGSNRMQGADWPLRLASTASQSHW